MGENKMGNMTHNDLMSALSAMLDEKLSSLANKQVFKLLSEELNTFKN